MRAPSAPPFTRIPAATITSTLSINGIDISQGIPDVDPDGHFSLNLTLTYPAGAIFSASSQKESAQLDFVVDLRSDTLKLRQVLHVERLLPGPDTTMTYIDRLPGKVFHAGAELRVCICATAPAPVDEFACDRIGGILWEERIPFSKGSNAPALPIEFVDPASNFTRTWATDFGGVRVEDLDAPATGAIRVYVANSTPLENALRSEVDSPAFVLATRLVALEVSVDAVIHVLSDDELLDKIDSAQGAKPTWSENEDTIGYFLIDRCSMATGARSLDSLRDEFRSDPNEVRKQLREVFSRW